MMYSGQAVSFDSKQQVGSLPLACGGWNKILSLVWKLCGLTKAQCAVVNTMFIEGLTLWIWFSYVIRQPGFTVNDCVYCVGTLVSMYAV